MEQGTPNSLTLSREVTIAASLTPVQSRLTQISQYYILLGRSDMVFE